MEVSLICWPVEGTLVTFLSEREDADKESSQRSNLLQNTTRTASCHSRQLSARSIANDLIP